MVYNNNIYNNNDFDNKREAQKWWVSKSLQEFKNKLSEYNISLEVIETETYKSFFEKLFKKKIILFSISTHFD